MAKRRQVKKISVDRNFRKCPSCEYTDGFHVMFKRSHKDEKRFRVMLVCPMCSQTYDMGLEVTSYQREPRVGE